MRIFPVFVAVLLVAVALLGSPALAAPKKKKKAKKGPDYDSNPYKAVVEKEPSYYRFNSKGEAVDDPAYKKKAKKAKKKPEGEEAPPEAAPAEEKPAEPAEPAGN